MIVVCAWVYPAHLCLCDCQENIIVFAFSESFCILTSVLLFFQLNWCVRSVSWALRLWNRAMPSPPLDPMFSSWPIILTGTPRTRSNHLGTPTPSAYLPVFPSYVWTSRPSLLTFTTVYFKQSAVAPCMQLFISSCCLCLFSPSTFVFSIKINCCCYLKEGNFVFWTYNHYAVVKVLVWFQFLVETLLLLIFPFLRD